MNNVNPKPNPVKAAVIGADSYIGRHLLAAARQAVPDCIGTSRRRAGGLPFLDLACPDIRGLHLAATGHTHAIIAAARPSIMFCETYPRAAEAVNVRGTVDLARQLAAEGITPVFLSSDRVFDAAGSGPFDETARPECTAVYGLQKIAVEEVLAAQKAPTLTVRLSKIYGLERGDRTLFDNMAARLLSGRMVDPPFDQYFNPTWVADVAAGILALLDAGASGTVHLCAQPPVSRRELGLEMARLLAVDPALVPKPPEPSVTTPLAAERFSRLTGLTPLPPREALNRVAAAYRSGGLPCKGAR